MLTCLQNNYTCLIIILSTSIIVIMSSEPNIVNKKICLKIKMERIKRGWSQDILSENCGISKNSIGAIERGKSNPSSLTLAKIATAFGITVSELTDISKVDL